MPKPFLQLGSATTPPLPSGAGSAGWPHKSGEACLEVIRALLSDESALQSHVPQYEALRAELQEIGLGLLSWRPGQKGTVRLMNWKNPPPEASLHGRPAHPGRTLLPADSWTPCSPILRSVHLWLLLGLVCLAAYVSLEALGSRIHFPGAGTRSLRRCLGYSAAGLCNPSITVPPPAAASTGLGHGGTAFLWPMARWPCLLLAVAIRPPYPLRRGRLRDPGRRAGWELQHGLVLLLLGVSVNLALTAGMLGVMFLPARPGRYHP